MSAAAKKKAASPAAVPTFGWGEKRLKALDIIKRNLHAERRVVIDKIQAALNITRANAHSYFTVLAKRKPAGPARKSAAKSKPPAKSKAKKAAVKR